MQFLGEKPHSSIQKPILETVDYFDGNLVRVGSSAVRAPPVAAAAKMRFDAKIAVISTGYSSHKTSNKTFIYVIHNEVIP